MKFHPSRIEVHGRSSAAGRTREFSWNDYRPDRYASSRFPPVRAAENDSAATRGGGGVEVGFEGRVTVRVDNAAVIFRGEIESRSGSSSRESHLSRSVGRKRVLSSRRWKNVVFPPRRGGRCLPRRDAEISQRRGATRTCSICASPVAERILALRGRYRAAARGNARLAIATVAGRLFISQIASYGPAALARI